MKNQLSLSIIALCALLLIQSCTSDNLDPISNFGENNIDQSEYTAGGTLAFSYSLDGGGTYTTTMPTNIATGATVKTKIVNGASDLAIEDFSFDWTGSVPAPTDKNSNIFETKKTTDNITLNVKIKDKQSIVAINVNANRIVAVDQSTGRLGKSFSPLYPGVEDISSILYHPKSKKTFVLGFLTNNIGQSRRTLFSLNKNSKELTLIKTFADLSNQPHSLQLSPDDSLVVSGVRYGTILTTGAILYKMSIDGNVSDKINLPKPAVYSDSMFPLYNSKLNISTVVEFYNEYKPVSMITAGVNIFDVNLLTGAISNDFGITTFTDFPTAPGGLNAATGNTVDGVCYAIFTSYPIHYFASIDLKSKTAKYISTINTTDASNFKFIATIPNHAL